MTCADTSSRFLFAFGFPTNKLEQNHSYGIMILHNMDSLKAHIVDVRFADRRYIFISPIQPLEHHFYIIQYVIKCKKSRPKKGREGKPVVPPLFPQGARLLYGFNAVSGVPGRFIIGVSGAECTLFTVTGSHRPPALCQQVKAFPRHRLIWNYLHYIGRGVDCQCPLSHLSGAVDNILATGELLKTHGASCVHFLGGDADFGAEAEFAAVGEASRGVDVDGCGVHLV